MGKYVLCPLPSQWIDTNNQTISHHVSPWKQGATDDDSIEALDGHHVSPCRVGSEVTFASLLFAHGINASEPIICGQADQESNDVGLMIGRSHSKGRNGRTGIPLNDGMDRVRHEVLWVVN
jgi:hypothetical protein